MVRLSPSICIYIRTRTPWPLALILGKKFTGVLTTNGVQVRIELMIMHNVNYNHDHAERERERERERAYQTMPMTVVRAYLSLIL